MARSKTNSKGIKVSADDCQGFDLQLPQGPNPVCKGAVAWRTRDAMSFGLPFTTHAMLCDAHGSALGFQLVETMGGGAGPGA